MTNNQSPRWWKFAIALAAFICAIPFPVAASVELPNSATSWLRPQTDLPPLGDPARFLPIEPSEDVQTQLKLTIRLSDRRVYLYKDDELHRSYPIAVGKSGWETPTGTFEVMQMIRDPAWEHPWTGEVVPPGPDNPLGDRWIGFWTDGVNVIGFHGTPNEELIGQAVSHGCIRMRNNDVRALFEQVEVGTPVTVEP